MPLIPTFLIVATVLVIRIGFAVTFPLHDGDATNYYTHALHWAELGCLSPVRECTFSWGGNQIPGHVTFMTAIIKILGLEGRSLDQAPLDILIIQNILVVASALYLATRAHESWKNTKLSYALFLVATLSPLSLPWGRTVLTEALTLALIAWTVAEVLVIASPAKPTTKAAIFRLGLALSLSMLWRVDMIILCPVIGIVLWRYDRLGTALRLAAVTTIITGIAVGSWLIHGYRTGATSIPSYYNAPQDTHSYATWSTTWLRSKKDLANSTWRLWQRDYGKIDLPPYAWIDEEDKQIVQNLHQRLSALKDQPLPEDLQQAFVDLRALQLSKLTTLERYIIRPGYRTLWLWLDPYNTMYWPTPALSEADKKAVQENGIQAVMHSPSIALIINFSERGFLFAYRSGILILFLWLLIRTYRNDDKPLQALMLGALLFAIFRTLFFSQLGGVETRYIIESYHFIEIASIALLFSGRQHRSRLATA